MNGWMQPLKWYVSPSVWKIKLIMIMVTGSGNHLCGFVLARAAWWIVWQTATNHLLQTAGKHSHSGAQRCNDAVPQSHRLTDDTCHVTGRRQHRIHWKILMNDPMTFCCGLCRWAFDKFWHYWHHAHISFLAVVFFGRKISVQKCKICQLGASWKRPFWGIIGTFSTLNFVS